MAEFSSEDSRGIVRGKCRECSRCEGYIFDTRKSIKCVRCHHAPGQHEKVDDDMETEIVVTSGVPSEESVSSSFQQCLQLDHNVTPFQGMELSVIHQPTYASVCSRSDDSPHCPTTMHIQNSSADNDKVHMEQNRRLPKCANKCCQRSVYVDSQLKNQFKYCSPTCRDQDMLNDASRSIQINIAALEQELDGVVVDDRHFSDYIATNPGHCSFHGTHSSSLVTGKDKKKKQSIPKDTMLEAKQTQWPPRCANKLCKRSVYIDHQLPQDLQEFKYCSPDCRDKVVQDITIKSTADQTVLLEAALHGALDIQSFSKYLAKNPGGCMTCSTRTTSNAPPKDTKKSSRGEMKLGATKEQERIRIVIKKKRFNDDMGITLCKEAYTSGEIHGFFISGLKKYGVAYEEKSIRLLDVIISVEDIPVTPEKMKSLFDGNKCVRLECFRSYGIPLKSDVLSTVKEYTHLFAVMCTVQKIGIVLQAKSDKIVIEVKEGSIAENSGLHTDDILKGFLTTAKTIEPGNVVMGNDAHLLKEKFRKYVEEAKKIKANLIFFVKRDSNLVSLV